MKIKGFKTPYSTFLSLLFILFSWELGLAAEQCKSLPIPRKSAATIEMDFKTQESWGQQILLKRIKDYSEFDQHLQSLTNADDQIELILAEDLRSLLFELEELFRLYSRHDKTFFKPLRDSAKELEDQIGDVALQRSLRLKSKELKQPILETYFLHFENEAKSKTLQLVTTWRSKTLNDIRFAIETYSQWLLGTTDRMFLIQTLSNEARKLHKAAIANEFDQSDIELGYHELRRAIRRLSINANSLHRVVQYVHEPSLSPSVHDWFQEAQATNPKILDSKYLKPHPAPIDGSIHLPLKMQALLGQIILEMGEVKDKSEMQIFFEKAMTNLNFTDLQKENVLNLLNTNLKTGPIDHQILAKRLQQRLIETGLIQEYATFIK